MPGDDVIAELAAGPVGSMVYGPCPSMVEDEGAGLFVRETSRATNTRDIEIRVGLFVEHGASPGVVAIAGRKHYVAWLSY